MMAPPTSTGQARTIRLIHAAMVGGVLLFAVVAQLALKPAFADSGGMPSVIVNAALGVAMVACAASLVLRRRVPKRSTGQSADLYWTTASVPALLAWAALEGACLLCIFIYALSGASPAIGVGVLAVLIFIFLSPAYFEKR